MCWADAAKEEKPRRLCAICANSRKFGNSVLILDRMIILHYPCNPAPLPVDNAVQVVKGMLRRRENGSYAAGIDIDRSFWFCGTEIHQGGDRKIPVVLYCPT